MKTPPKKTLKDQVHEVIDKNFIGETFEYVELWDKVKRTLQMLISKNNKPKDQKEPPKRFYGILISLTTEKSPRVKKLGEYTFCNLKIKKPSNPIHETKMLIPMEWQTQKQSSDKVWDFPPAKVNKHAKSPVIMQVDSVQTDLKGNILNIATKGSKRRYRTKGNERREFIFNQVMLKHFVGLSFKTRDVFNKIPQKSSRSLGITKKLLSNDMRRMRKEYHWIDGRNRLYYIVADKSDSQVSNSNLIHSEDKSESTAESEGDTDNENDNQTSDQNGSGVDTTQSETDFIESECTRDETDDNSDSVTLIESPSKTILKSRKRLFNEVETVEIIPSKHTKCEEPAKTIAIHQTPKPKYLECINLFEKSVEGGIVQHTRYCSTCIIPFKNEELNSVVSCGYNGCLKSFHKDCAAQFERKGGKINCPSHICHTKNCKNQVAVDCNLCTTGYCNEHRRTNGERNIIASLNITICMDCKDCSGIKFE